MPTRLASMRKVDGWMGGVSFVGLFRFILAEGKPQYTTQVLSTGNQSIHHDIID